MDKEKLSLEEKYIFDVIIAAREIQTFLWGIANGAWGLEEWRRMFIKRFKKIENIDKNNPHAMIELKKRLLQNAALSIALMAILHDETKLIDETMIPSNLPGYTSYEKDVGIESDNMRIDIEGHLKKQHIASKNAVRNFFTSRYDYHESIAVQELVDVSDEMTFDRCKIDRDP